jgi:hypothetical protein
MLSWNAIQAKALDFSKTWKDAKDEEAQAQLFLNDFFGVFGVDLKRVATFEKKVPQGPNRNGYIDLLWRGVILIEMKSRGKSLDKAYNQARDYAFHLEDEELPEYIMVCDFENIRLYRQTTGQIWNFKTSQLHKNVKLFAELAGYKTTTDMPTDIHVDKKAAEKMARLHDVLKAHGYEGHDLEVYLVRLLFCMFADDTGIFEKNIFFEYISRSKEDGSDLSTRIARLFEVLNMPPEQRDKQALLSDELRRFAYINGKLFAEPLRFADFDASMRKMLLECCSMDWGYISPAIFGAMFQGVMNPQERRELGAHYTSEENILKLIKPLFLDELWAEFERIKGSTKQLEQFHNKLSGLKFLDPACGCGNFLIISYRELRRLELEVLKMLIDHGGQLVMDITPYCKVTISQFYGIEYEEFPCQIAQVGMWLIDHQMNTLFSEHFGLYFARLPLKTAATIVHGNALRIDWESIVPKHELSYIMGNPPFNGARTMNEDQKQDMLHVFGNLKGVGNLDYVTAWYRKAADMMSGTHIQAAFVSTNSISQGEQVSILWKPLMRVEGICINFGYRTFKWSNEAKGKAAVHCVIVGFSIHPTKREKIIFENDGSMIIAQNINPYLVNAENVFVESHTRPICNVPAMSVGNQPIDGGFYLFSKQEMEAFVSIEPQSEKWFRRWLGSHEFINGYFRYYLFLKDCPPNELKQMPESMKRIDRVKEFRLSSTRPVTRELARTPRNFAFENIPQSYFIIVPEVSSERRNYIPMGFLTPDILCSNLVKIIPDATLYHFGVLTSNIHMAWVRAVCGRLKSDYRYSANIVYNNFPWPDAKPEQQERIEKAAQAVLDARALFPDSSLADLYDPLTMPPELQKAHTALDREVSKAYGGKGFATEAERVADLMKRYQQLVENERR